MKIYNLSGPANSLCFILKHAGVTVMLDCHLDTSALHRFLPVTIMDDFSKRCTASSECIKVIEESEFIDATPEFNVPQTDQVDMASVDAILITTHHSMLALPYITEYTEFNGVVYATEPSLTFGKLLMEELVANVSKVKKEKLSSSSPSIKNELENLMKGGGREWRACYNKYDVTSCVSKVTLVAFNEVMEVPCGLKIKAVSSGYCIGSCNWVVFSDYHKISYIGASSALSTHTMPMWKVELKSCDVMLMSCLTQNPHNNPDNYMREFCLNTSMTLKKKGRVLVPCSVVGVIFDLIDCLFSHLDSSSLLSTPVYIISPVAKDSLAFSNIYAEWLSSHKQSKVYQPEAPFVHSELMKSKRLETFQSMSEGFSKAVKHPCVVFCSDQLLRYGDAVDFMLHWKGNSNNSVIFTDPTLNCLEVLGPYLPMKMKVFHCPIDTRLSISQANKLAKELQPSHLILPQQYVNQFNPELSIDSDLHPLPLGQGSMQRVSLKRKFQKMIVAAEITDSLDVKKIKNNLCVSVISGYVSAKDYKYMLKPLSKPLKASSIDEAASHKALGEPLLKPRLTFKPPNAARLMQNLHRVGVEAVMEEKADGHVVVAMPKENALIEIKNDSSDIRFNNDTSVSNNTNWKAYKTIKNALFMSFTD